MPRLITRGRFTQEYVKRMIAAPEDREPAIRKLVEAAGGKLLNLYFTTGDADFELITEGESEDHIAGIMTAAAAGMISDMTTSRAWTAAEFKGIAEKAAKLASAYKAPGQS
jgi:uncharacterized protein with GYD domain